MEQPTETQTSQFQPFQNIGLCFSGGGYRASCFSLGILSYLNRVKLEDGQNLLSHVTALSSVSGGTLTAAAYAYYESKKRPFEDFYKEYYRFLDEDRLLNLATGKLKDDQVWKGNHKRRSLINAFSLAYQELFYHESSIEDIMKAPASTSLKDACFNSTDFSFGLAFRFQNTGDLGSRPFNLPKQNSELDALRGQVLLADAVASSSCFPIGFAPMIMPDDYFSDHDDETYKRLKAQENFVKGVGIMDGGIVDNQGIGSMILIDRRRPVDQKLSLMMMCDVSGYRMDPWEKDDSQVTKGGSLRQLGIKIWYMLGNRWYFWLILLLGAAMVLLNRLGMLGETKAWMDIMGSVLGTLGLILVIAGTTIGNFKRNVFNGIKKLFKKNVPEVLFDDLQNLASLNVNLVKRMLTDRATSGMKMINEVFLKQMRRLNYSLIYQTKGYENKLVTTTVYELNGQPILYKNNPFNPNIDPKPSKVLEEVGLIASETPTTLWWDAKDREVDRLQCLIACGQFTACYDLLDHLLKLKAAGVIGNEYDALQKSLEEDWKDFNANPRFMV